jgi:hypothetical protein
MRHVPGKSCRDNPNTHLAFKNFFPENLTFYEIIWKNIVELGRSQMTK